jgi:hypothetical protein
MVTRADRLQALRELEPRHIYKDNWAGRGDTICLRYRFGTGVLPVPAIKQEAREDEPEMKSI